MAEEFCAVFSLDGGEHLLTLDNASNLAEEVEKKLGICKENQVYYVMLKKRSPTNIPAILWKSHNINIGYKATKKIHDESEIIRRVNGDYGNIRIMNKFRETELLKQFKSKPWSTYNDLKQYIESELNIPVRIQAILRRTSKGCYWVPKDDEFLLNYVLDEDDLNPVSKYVNTVYLWIEQSEIYTPLNNDITVIKPISIYTRHDPNEKTKILTIFPDEHILTIAEMKSRIGKHFDLPATCLTIYTENAESITTKLYDFLEDFYESSENEAVFYLTCDCRQDETQSKICKEYGIKMVEVQIVTPSENIVSEIPLKVNMTIGDLKSLVEKEHILPKTKLIFYDTNFKIMSDHQDVWEHFEWQRLNRACKIYIFFEKSELRYGIEACKKFGIPQVSSEIIITSPSGSEALHKVDMAHHEWKERPWYHIVTEDIKQNLNIPTNDFFLSLNGEILDINHVATHQTDWRHLFFLNGDAKEEIVFNLAFKPTTNTQLEEICRNNNILMFKTLRIRSITSTINIDIRKEPMENILQVKEFIAKEKKLPTCTVDLFFGKTALDDNENLIELFIKTNTTDSTLELFVVIKAMKDVRINLRSPYTERMPLPIDHILVAGSKTFSHVKEDIAALIGTSSSELIGISSSQLRLTCPDVKNIPDDSFIKDLVTDETTNEIDLMIWKTVRLCKINMYGNTKTETHEIANDDETVRDLILRVNFDKRFEFHKKKKITKKTLLHDLRSDDVIELKEKEDCKQM